MVSTHASFALHEPLDGEKLAEFRSTLRDSVEAGVRDVTIDLDGLTRLDNGVIATLLFSLRTLRERGGKVSLSVVRKSVLETLRITGLDRIFAMAHA